MKIREGVNVVDTKGMSTLDIIKMMYDGDVPDDTVDIVKKYADELVELNWYTITGWRKGDSRFSTAATALTFALGLMAGREENHD